MKTVHSFYYVFLPDSKKPIFPDQCIVCGQSGAEELKWVQITDDLGRVQFYFFGLGHDEEEDLHLYVPVHNSCGKGVRSGFLKSFALLLSAAAAIAASGIALGMGSFISLLIAIIVAGPLLSILLSKPVPFELNHGGGKLHLKFNNRDYAERVARLNHSEVIECRQHILGNEEQVSPSGRDARQGYRRW